MYEKIVVIFFIANIPILFFYDFINKKIKLYDYNDGKRKFQKNPVPLIGGLLLIYNILLFVLLDYQIDFEKPIYEYFSNTREYFAFFVGLTFCFLLGLYDDKFNLGANKKILINFFIILLIILIDENLVIKELSFIFLENPIDLRNLSYFFTILCFLLFINALNMFDGMNLQVGTYCILIFSIFIFKNSYVVLSLIIILSLILFLFYNFSNKAFLGDNGTQILAFLISYIIIKSYKFGNILQPEEIFVFLALPGLDMFRLFLVRIMNGKNPFTPDLNHIHHLLIRKYNKNVAYLLIQTFIIFHIILYYLIESKIIVLSIVIIFYLIFLLFSKKHLVK